MDAETWVRLCGVMLPGMPLPMLPLNLVFKGGGSGEASGFPAHGHAHRPLHFTPRVFLSSRTLPAGEHPRETREEYSGVGPPSDAPGDGRSLPESRVARISSRSDLESLRSRVAQISSWRMPPRALPSFSDRRSTSRCVPSVRPEREPSLERAS